MKIIYDGTILEYVKKNGRGRTGIFFVAWNLYRELIKMDLEIVLFVEPLAYVEVSKLIKNGDLGENVQLLFSNIGWYKFAAYLINWIKEKNIGKIGELFIYAIDFFALLFLNFSKNAKNEIIKYDVFFSPQKMYPAIFKKSNTLLKSIFLHDVIALRYPEYFPKMKRKWPKYWLVQLVNSLNNSDLYFANSICTKNDFLRERPDVKEERIIVAPLACNHIYSKKNDFDDMVLKKYDLKGDKKFVFSLCTIEPRKNLIRIIKTFLHFIEKNNITDMVFVIGGAKWDSFEKIFNKETSNREWKKYIHYIGYVDDEDLPYIYSKAEWFVYTSQYEGFGLPILEAMSCGCPVIASDSSSIPEVVGDAGLLIQWDNDEEHISAYEKYYYNNQLREECSNKGIQQAKKFSWKKTAEIVYENFVTHS